MKPSVIFAQETKYKEEGQLKLGDEYIVYEQVRKGEKGGGGLALCCLKELNPCLVSEGKDCVEAISVDIYLNNMKIRCCTAYGPQENENIEKKYAFWEHLDREVFEAENAGAGFVLQFDGNLWAGDRIVPKDPRPQNKNGKFLEQFLERNPRLTVVNSLPECQGLVTRSRLKDGVLEESVLDFFIVCSSVLPFVTRMVIDENKQHILTNYRAGKKNGKAVDSDHYTEYLDLNIEITKEKTERLEIFNFKDKISQEVFKKNTSKTDQFTKCFEGEDLLSEKIEKWRKLLDSECSKAFKKIRIKDRKMKPISKKISNLIDKRNSISKIGCTCEKNSLKRKDLILHTKSHTETRFTCEECVKNFTTRRFYQLHIKKEHTDKGKFICEICGKRFEKKVNFYKHKKAHTKNSNYQCGKCEKRFVNVSTLTDHTNLKHKEIRTENYHECRECGKKFLFDKSYKSHKRIHRGWGEFKCAFCSKQIESINAAIAELEATENRDRVMKQFKFFSDNPENIEMQKMWKTLKNICPNQKPILPTAKKNHLGKIVSSKNDIKKLLAKEYENRLRSRPYRYDLNDTKLRRKRLFYLKLNYAENNKSQPWTIHDLEKALKDLKRNKSRDSEGLINEIFKTDVIGSNLKSSLLILFNNLKKENVISEFMNYANITTVPKKGPKIDLQNQRGIFRVSVIRSILMRMIYNSKYAKIDRQISDGQMGARKGKGCKSNIWIINGIIHETLQDKKTKPIMLQIYDYCQMFDSINLQEAVSDIFDYGLDDEELSLIYKANEKIYMAVKTQGGLTERKVIKNSVLQGDTFGSLLASVQVDTIARDVEKAGIGYEYKGKLPINILGLVDDIIGISEAGHKAQIMNTILNLKSAEKTLQFGSNKCKVMIVGKNKNNVRSNPIYVDNWTKSYNQNQQTGEIELEEKYEGKVPIEEVVHQKYLGFVLSSTGSNSANIEATEKKSFGVIRTIMTKLDKLKLRKYYFEC